MRFQRRDPTPEELARAQRIAPKIRELVEQGKSKRYICGKFGLPVAAVESVIDGGRPAGEMNMPPGDARTMGGEHVASGGGNVTNSGQKVREAVEQKPPPEKKGGVAREKAAREAGDEGGPTVENDPLSDEFQREAWMSTDSAFSSYVGGQEVPGQPRPPKELEGVFDVPNIYRSLFYALVEFGVGVERARGIIRVFKHYRPEDYTALDEVMRDAGLPITVRKPVLKAWRLETTDPADTANDGATVTPKDADEREVVRRRLGAIKREMGLNDGDDVLQELEDLEREKMRLEIEEMRENLRRKKEQGGEPDNEETTEIMVKIGGIPMRKTIKLRDLPMWKPLIYNPESETADEDTVEVLLDINGVRAHKKVKLSELDKWKQYIVKEQPAVPETEMIEVVLDINGVPITQKIPKDRLPQYARWMKGPDEEKKKENDELESVRQQMAQLQAQLERERKEYEEQQREAKRQAEIQALQNRIEGLQQALTSNPGKSEVEARLEKLREEIEKQREERYRSQIEGLQQTLENYRTELRELNNRMERMSNYDYIIQQQERLKDLGRKAGLIPKEEARQMQEEDIALTEQMNAVKRKDEAQAELLHIGADKLKSTGRLKEEVLSKGGADVLVKALQRITTPPSEAQAAMYSPTPEELAEAMNRIGHQREVTAQTPATQMQVQDTQQPPPPEAQPQGAGGIPGYRPVVPEEKKIVPNEGPVV